MVVLEECGNVAKMIKGGRLLTSLPCWIANARWNRIYTLPRRNIMTGSVMVMMRRSWSRL